MNAINNGFASIRELNSMVSTSDYVDTSNCQAVATITNTSTITCHPFINGEKFHRVPHDFQLPTTNVTLRTALRLWFDGLPQSKIPAFKTLDKHDFNSSSPNYKKKRESTR